MVSDALKQLLERTLVIAAHPDDECIAAGALLQRVRDARVVFCTDGAPRDEYFWHSFSSRERYAEIRRNEAACAAEAVGISQPAFLGITDQELYLNLRHAHRTLETVILKFRPDAILTLAYEGGHPDHDCCAFLGHILGAEHKILVWETPLYHRTTRGACNQQFLYPTDDVIRLHVDSDERRRKMKMAACYKSQAAIVGSFDQSLELFRPQFQYDFCKPPAADLINYEFWEWSMTARDVSTAFSAFPGEGTAKNSRLLLDGHSLPDRYLW